MIDIENLELHITHSCNFSCESCSHFSNQKIDGKISLESATLWLDNWSKRLSPKVFSILGGEPTLHPELSQFLVTARHYWKDTHLRLVTNGFFLHRHPELPKVLSKDNNACLYVSLHHNSEEYQKAFQPIEILLAQWEHDYHITVRYYESYKYWTRRYFGNGANILPYNDNNPEESWENCAAKKYFQIHNGKIWKCAPLAFLPLVKKKYGLSDDWNEFLTYTPLQFSCTDDELVQFFSQKSESFCGMCPANPVKFDLPLPFKERKYFQ